MKASQKAWMSFIKTGNIADYMHYRELLKYETSGEITPAEEDTDASEDRWNSDKGDDDGRK